MKLKQFNNEANKAKPLTKGAKTVRHVLSMMFNVIEKFENNPKVISTKDDGERISILKNMVSDMLNDLEQKQLIRGNR